MHRRASIVIFTACILIVGLVAMWSVKGTEQEVASLPPTPAVTLIPLPASTPLSGPIAVPAVERLEIVTTSAVTGDGGNAWGAHKTRVVRTSTGRLFTAYMTAGGGYTARQWQLAERTAAGWQVVATGPAGREPVNLLVGPDDRLHIVGWPGGLPKLWSSADGGAGLLTFVVGPVPGAWMAGDWPYHAATVSPPGDLYVLQSTGEQPGELRWARRAAASGIWNFYITPLDYRYCYAYLFAGAAGQLSLVAGRDVRWTTLRYARPPSASEYVFNAVKYWHTPDVAAQPLVESLVDEEAPSASYRFVESYQRDAYLDTRGRMHVLYTRQGTRTAGREETRHAVIEAGAVIKDVAVPSNLGARARLLQDTTGRFYLLAGWENNGGVLYIYPADSADGTQLGQAVVLDLAGYQVRYPGLMLAAPRTGTALADYVDAVFPAGQSAEQWVYVRVRLR